MNYFSLFNLPTQFSLDLDQLSERYKDLQRRFHPDCFLTSPEVERLKAVEYSSMINKAWQTLRLPLSRAEYLLLLNGLDPKKEITLQDTGFLQVQFRLHEDLECIESSLKSNLLDEFIQRINVMQGSLYKQLTQACEEKKWSQAVDAVYKLRFMNRLKTRAELIEEKFIDL